MTWSVSTLRLASTFLLGLPSSRVVEFLPFPSLRWDSTTRSHPSCRAMSIVPPRPPESEPKCSPFRTRAASFGEDWGDDLVLQQRLQLVGATFEKSARVEGTLRDEELDDSLLAAAWGPRVTGRLEVAMAVMGRFGKLPKA